MHCCKKCYRGLWSRCTYAHEGRQSGIFLRFTALQWATGHRVRCSLFIPTLLHLQSFSQWWASYFHIVAVVLYFCYCFKKLASFNRLSIFYCNGFVTITSNCRFNCNEIVTSTTKSNQLHSGPLYHFISSVVGLALLF